MMFVSKLKGFPRRCSSDATASLTFDLQNVHICTKLEGTSRTWETRVPGEVCEKLIDEIAKLP